MDSHSPLEGAIALFISGDYARSRDELVRLSQRLEGTDRCTAYLYLGRCYLSLGAFDDAAETFNLGSMICGGDLFDEYLGQTRQYLRSAPELLARADTITRAQLACLVQHYFVSPGTPGTGPPVTPADIETHWAKEAIESVLACGYMQVLPDGRFHPREPVRRAAFAYQVARLICMIEGKRHTDLAGSFPDGVMRRIALYAGIGGGEDASGNISGRDAVNLLDNIERASRHTDEK